MTAIRIYQFPCLSDNYGVLVHNPETFATLLIDAPDEAAIRAALDETGWSLTHILVTHHHWDHTQAIEALKAETDCQVIGPRAEAVKIKFLDHLVDDDDILNLSGIEVRAVATPGHTIGQISYYLPEPGAARGIMCRGRGRSVPQPSERGRGPNRRCPMGSNHVRCNERCSRPVVWPSVWHQRHKRR